MLCGETMNSPYFGEHGAVGHSEPNGEDPFPKSAHNGEHRLGNELPVQSIQEDGSEAKANPNEHECVSDWM